MNVASLENSKRLHELAPGWDDTDYVWNQGASGNWYLITWETLVNLSGDDVPAPDLSWLLRKLPAFIDSNTRGYKIKLTLNVTSSGDRDATIGYEALRQVDRDRTAGVEFLYHPKIKFQHGTPEDAACLLLCELIEKGVIQL